MEDESTVDSSGDHFVELESSLLDVEELKEQVKVHGQQNVERLTKEMSELRSLLGVITMKLKVTHKRNGILLDDNNLLQQKLKELEAKKNAAEKNLAHWQTESQELRDTVDRLETALKDILSEGIQDKKKRRSLFLREKTTSTTHLATTQESKPEFFGKKVPEDVQYNDIAPRFERPSTSKTEVAAINHEELSPRHPPALPTIKPKEIKEVQKTKSSDTIAPTMKHSKIMKVLQELERLKNFSARKTCELEIKKKELKSKDFLVKSMRKEIAELKSRLNQQYLVAKARNDLKKRLAGQTSKSNAINSTNSEVTISETPGCSLE